MFLKAGENSFWKHILRFLDYGKGFDKIRGHNLFNIMKNILNDLLEINVYM
jgi:hypothetical protein